MIMRRAAIVSTLLPALAAIPLAAAVLGSSEATEQQNVPPAGAVPGAAAAADVTMQRPDSFATALPTSVTWRLPDELTSQELERRIADLDVEQRYWAEVTSIRRREIDVLYREGREQGGQRFQVDIAMRIRMLERAECRVQDVGAELNVLRARRSTTPR